MEERFLKIKEILKVFNNIIESYMGVIGYRFIAGLVLFLPLLFDIDEYFLILFTGSLISPCLSFVFPILAYNYYFKNELKNNKWKLAFNYIVLLIGISANAASFVQIIKSKE